MGFDYFDAVAYINLKHRKDRKKHILKEISKFSDKKAKHISATYVPFNGHLGCVLSHIDAIDWAISKKLNNILILEDDCYFIDDIELVNLAIEYFFKIVKKWDVFLLGGIFNKVEKSKYPYIYKVNKSRKSHAYVINKNYFSTLRDHFLSTANILRGYSYHLLAQEYALDRTWSELQKRDLWYTSNVYLAGQLDGISDIVWGHKNKRLI